MIRPLGDRVLIEANAKEETTASGIVLPDTRERKAARRQSCRSWQRRVERWRSCCA